MGKTYKERTHIWRVMIIIICCCIVAFAYLWAARTLHQNTANKHWQDKRYVARVNNPYNENMVDSCIQLLQTGDLAVRRGDDMTSYMLSRLNRQDKSYSHCGLVVVEDGQPYVYHCIGGEDNPDEKMKRETAQQWFSPANNHAFAVYRYDMQDSTNCKLVAEFHRLYKSELMFDMAFDMSTDDRQYCSEMIYKALIRVTADSNYVPTSANYGRMFVGIDNLYINSHTLPVCQVRFK